MLALSGSDLGFEFAVLDPAADACSASVARHVCADYRDQGALAHLVEMSDVITYEFENVPLDTVEGLESQLAVYPPAAALRATQDRYREKQLFRRLGIDTPPFAVFGSLEELTEQMRQIGYPAVIKTRSDGYDGKGQFVVRAEDQLPQVWHQLQGAEAIIEGFVPFDREISIIAVRGRDGEVVCYPLAVNYHDQGVLRQSVVLGDDEMQARAEAYIKTLLVHLDYVGVLALELFQCGDSLLANEYAPRVHNTGHWTMDGAVTGQFENHIRAITGLPLGVVASRGYAATLNIVGDLPDIAKILCLPHARLHLYNKQPRVGRKIGHVNLCCPDREQFDRQLNALQRLVKFVV